MGGAAEQQLLHLIGVYNADGSLAGELRYFIGRTRGTTHCELCDVTHGRLRKKRDFSALQTSFPVPLELLHLDEQPDDIAAVTDGRTPCVLAATPSGYRVILTTDDLARCHGDVQRFETALTRAVRSQNLVV